MLKIFDLFLILFLVITGQKAFGDDLVIPIQVINIGESAVNNPTVGTGDTKVVLYFDFYCNVCMAVCRLLKKFCSEEKNVQLILKPIGALGSRSHEAARYALAMKEQGKFDEFLNYVKEKGSHDKAISEIPGVDLKKLQEDINNKNVLELLARNSLEARKIAKSDITPIVAVVKKNRTETHVGFTSIKSIEQMIRSVEQG